MNPATSKAVQTNFYIEKKTKTFYNTIFINETAINNLFGINS